MTKLIRIITTSIIALLLTSCNFDISFGPGVTGNGEVVTESRNISGEFTKIGVTKGIEVILTQSENTSVEVEADSNLQGIITTEFNAEKQFLKISSQENIKSASAKVVHVSVPKLTSISTTSGAYVTTEGVFKADKMTIASTSGSHVEIDIDAKTLSCNSTSGAIIEANGSSKKLIAAATSGSYINADNLEAKISKASATSGASIKVNTSDELTASATSGGNIKYTGNPDKVSKNKAVSGVIKKI